MFDLHSLLTELLTYACAVAAAEVLAVARVDHGLAMAEASQELAAAREHASNQRLH
jgi:hypothetical protein